VLTHHERASRADSNVGRDETKVWQLTGDFLRSGDPYYSRHFSQERTDCMVDVRHIDIPRLERYSAATGVNLIGYIRAEMGVGQATRGTAAALAAAQVPFVVLDYEFGNPSRMGDQSWANKVRPSAVHNVNLLYINADLTPQAVAHLPKETFRNRYTIGSWTWELPEFPDEWTPAFGLVDEVWVPSAFVQSSIGAKSPVPVVRMPHAVRAPGGPFLGRTQLDLPEDKFIFLMMYDLHSVRQRKNPEGAVEAFTRAFRPDDETVALVMKLNNANRAERQFVASLTEKRSNIHVIDRALTRHEVDSLIAATDCFVSLHRSEGFGLAIAEAMALGKPALATYWSGNVDFMSPANSACIDYELVEIAADYGPYRAGQRWAEPNIDHAAWWMRELASNPERGRTMGERARLDVESALDPSVIGHLMADRLRYLPERRSN
jgi:glycosyltransferase involved in cell wall biosynthesis